MKQISLLMSLVIITGLSIYFVSCKKEKVYSCNDDLNNYASVTMASHQSISRDALSKMGLDTQFAIINSLSPDNNARILKEKIAILLKDATINSEDKTHLQKLSDYITSDIYTNPHLERDVFLNSWKNYAFNKLGWSQNKMEIYLHTWLSPSEISLMRSKSSPSTLHPNESESGGGDVALSCNCDGGYLCETILGKTCNTGGCDKTSWGCGFAWASSCTGRCSI